MFYIRLYCRSRMSSAIIIHPPTELYYYCVVLLGQRYADRNRVPIKELLLIISSSFCERIRSGRIL